jgi:hypothetical protein
MNPKAFTILALLLTSFAFCQATNQDVQCPEPRPTTCDNVQNEDVCGFVNERENDTYGNSCLACRFAEVKFFRAGKCPQHMNTPTTTPTPPTESTNITPNPNNLSVISVGGGDDWNHWGGLGDNWGPRVVRIGRPWGGVRVIRLDDDYWDGPRVIRLGHHLRRPRVIRLGDHWW